MRTPRNKGLIFPVLHFIRTESNFGNLINAASHEQKKDIYKLDWSSKDTVMRINFLTWLSKYYPKTSNLFTIQTSEIEDLSVEWNKKTKDVLFAIPHTYLTEIRKQSDQAVEKWTETYPFDTVIRDLCLEPAISHVMVAFKLLGDCIYDETTNYYLRTMEKKILTHAMLYKFWAGQTGRGLLQGHACFDELRELLNSRNRDFFEIQSFLNSIEEHERIVNMTYNTVQ